MIPILLDGGITTEMNYNQILGLKSLIESTYAYCQHAVMFTCFIPFSTILCVSNCITESTNSLLVYRYICLFRNELTVEIALETEIFSSVFCYFFNTCSETLNYNRYYGTSTRD